MSKKRVKIKFRDIDPTRRTNPQEVTKYQNHKPDLRVDFNSYCGYCHSNDRYRETYYEVDHFVPRDIFSKNGNISDTDYCNLVYSCRRCNNAKRKKWPSQDETVHHVNDEGFLDPCDPEYSKQFYRCTRGRIYPDSNLGKWMYKTFKFENRERQLELVWQLERLHYALQSLIKEQKKYPENSETWDSIETQLNLGTRVYYEFDVELKDFNSK